MEKTALMELIEWMNENSGIVDGKIVHKATELLEKEKEDNRKSWRHGKKFGIAAMVEYHGGSENDVPDFNDYFTTTYNQ